MLQVSRLVSEMYLWHLIKNYSAVWLLPIVYRCIIATLDELEGEK